MKSFLTFIFLFLCVPCFANIYNGDADSIKSLLETLPDYQKSPDTAVINKLNQLAEEYFRTNPDSTYYYGNKSIELSKKIHYQAGVAGGLLQTGHVSYLQGRSSEAKQDLAEAIAIYKKLHDYKGLSKTYISCARMYNLLANYPLALSYLKLAEAINKKIKDEHGLTDTYKNIGIIYYSQGLISNALDYYYKALFIAIKNHYTGLSSDLYNDIGVVLQSMEVYPNALAYFDKALITSEATDIQGVGTINENIGEILLAQGKYDESISHLKKALAIAKKQDDKDGLGSIYTDLGLCYAHKNQDKLAVSYLDTSLQVATVFKFVYNQAYAFIGLATVYNMQKDYANAYKYAVQGQASAVKLGNLSVRANAALQLNKTLAGLGQYDKAYAMLNEYLDLKNQLKNNESIQKLTSYNFELDFAAKAHQLAQQQQERDLLYQQKIRSQRLINSIFFIVILAMVITSVVYYKQKRKQQAINLMLEEKNHEVLSQKASINDQAEKLNELNILKDRLISILAHDLRAPLSTLRGLFSLLQDDTITHQQLVAMIPTVLKRLEYTSDFLDTLLSWINSQMENFDSSVKNFSVKEIVSREIESYHEQAALKGIELMSNISSDLQASADPNSIRIVIRNLITNAIKFSGDNDTIEILAENGNDHDIVIKVKDSGLGIAPEQLTKLFKSKVDSGTGTRNESGTGMGLLFCKDLVEKCNGRIWVTSQQGSGSEFTFTIPANQVLEVA